jgi:hypothetical protein
MTESVSEVRPPTSKSGMGLIGWLIFFGMVVLIIPLLPILLLIRLYNRIVGDDREEE